MGRGIFVLSLLHFWHPPRQHTTLGCDLVSVVSVHVGAQDQVRTCLALAGTPVILYYDYFA